MFDHYHFESMECLVTAQLITGSPGNGNLEYRALCGLSILLAQEGVKVLEISWQNKTYHPQHDQTFG
jgi:hypothetical protein